MEGNRNNSDSHPRRWGEAQMTDSGTGSLLAAIETLPPGTLKFFKGTDKEPAVEASMRNRAELSRRMSHARNVHCWIEVISLRLQYLDLWLRIYFDNVEKPSSPKVKREREFGRLLRQCFELGLEKRLYDKINLFNAKRIKAIHGYLVGSIAYKEVEKAVTDSDDLPTAVTEFVLKNAGAPVTSAFKDEYHGRGDAVYHIPNLLMSLKMDPV